MKVNRQLTRIETNLGELIATISDVAFENSDNPQEAYELTRLVLAEMLKIASFKNGIDVRLHDTSQLLH